MKMIDRLPAIGPGVDDRPEAFRESFALGKSAGN
jgi:hypothetical protein